MRLGLINIVDQPTHEGHKLDRIYVSRPLYPTVKVISSGIKTKHLAIVARSDGGNIVNINKRSTLIFCPHTVQYDKMLMEMQFFSWEHVFNSTETQKALTSFLWP